MSLNFNREGPSYRLQPSSPYATFFDDHTISQGSLESTSDSSTIPLLARSTVQSPRERRCSVLFIFTFYLLLSLCLAIGLTYTDDRRVFLVQWLIGHANMPGSVTSPVWEGLKGGEHCLRYGTREYTARLSTNAIGLEAMRACKETPIEIHGQLLHTDFCQDLGLGRGVWGFWIVSSDEPACQTTWGKFVDLGCVNNGLDMETSFRRIEARLDNLPIGANWRIMCTTTPADIYGRHFFTPAECFNLGKLGIFGAWDSSC